MTSLEADAWLRVRRAVAQPRVRLLCLPYAGGSATVFGAWNNLPADVEVCAAQLPGRQDRLGEPALTAVEPIVARLVDALGTRPAAPLAVYGHSFGALLAFELSLELQSAGKAPIALIVGARPAPQLPPAREAIHHLPQHAFLRAIHVRYGTPLDVLEDPDLMPLIVPPLRADLKALETHRPAPGAKVDVPITALRGRRDQVVEVREMEAWQEVTTRTVNVHEIDAGHFFVDTHRAWVQERVAEAIAAAG